MPVNCLLYTSFGGAQVEALRDVNFTVEEGEYVAIMGESGSGKTTLLNILATLDKPTAGAVALRGQDLARVAEGKLAQFRREHLGFVFQDFHLLDTFTLRDNIYPVSYTHLDMYKRQIQCRTCRAARPASAPGWGCRPRRCGRCPRRKSASAG